MLGCIVVDNKNFITTASAFQWGCCCPSILHINAMKIGFILLVI